MSIEVTGLNKKFGDFVALDDVNVTIPTGQLTALLGPSGGGKSTLLRIIAGLEKADTGSVTIEGVEATHLPAQKRNVGFVFQHYAVFKHMTVAKNVAFGLEIRKRPKDEIEHRVQELLKLVHLSQFAHRLPSQLSGGQRQRMALARALAVEPSVLLLDEPFGALDAKVRKELRDWLRRLHDDVHVTTVFVTHDQEEALEVADEIVVINEGRVEQVGTPDQLYDEPANDFVMSFLGEVTHLGGVSLRPHDIELESSPQLAGSVEGTISRMVRIGFEVRLHVLTVDGDEVSVVVTRAHARSQGLQEGQHRLAHPCGWGDRGPADGCGRLTDRRLGQKVTRRRRRGLACACEHRDDRRRAVGRRRDLRRRGRGDRHRQAPLGRAAVRRGDRCGAALPAGGRRPLGGRHDLGRPRALRQRHAAPHADRAGRRAPGTRCWRTPRRSRRSSSSPARRGSGTTWCCSAWR